MAMIACASGALAATTTSRLGDGRTLVVSAAVIDGIGISSTKLVLTGKAHVKLFDKAAGSTLDASADKIVVLIGAASKDRTKAISSIRSAELVGSPQIVHETKDPDTGRQMKTTATSTTVSYDGSTETVYLKGSVKITNENPSLFDGPAEMTGDEASIRVSSNLGPEDTRFRISSSPGVSTIIATPKSKKETQPKK